MKYGTPSPVRVIPTSVIPLRTMSPITRGAERSEEEARREWETERLRERVGRERERRFGKVIPASLIRAAKSKGHEKYPGSFVCRLH